MRITDPMLAQRVIDSINESKSRLGNLQQILSTGKRVNKPSDDPLRISHILNLRGKVKDIEQYLKNVEIAATWLGLTTQAVSQVGEVINGVRVVALRESNATSTPESQAVSAEEVRSLKVQLRNLANSTYGGRYLFAGTKTLTAPFDEDGTYWGDQGEIELQIGEKRTITINSSGDKVFQEGEDVFAVLSDLETALEDGDSPGISNQLEKLDDCLSQIHQWEGNLGGRARRVEISKNRLEDETVQMTTLLSSAEDADMIKIVVELQAAGTAYQAALSAGGQILEFTLIKFWD